MRPIGLRVSGAVFLCRPVHQCLARVFVVRGYSFHVLLVEGRCDDNQYEVGATRRPRECGAALFYPYLIAYVNGLVLTLMDCGFRVVYGLSVGVNDRFANVRRQCDAIGVRVGDDAKDVYRANVFRGASAATIL